MDQQGQLIGQVQKHLHKLTVANIKSAEVHSYIYSEYATQDAAMYDACYINVGLHTAGHDPITFNHLVEVVTIDENGVIRDEECTHGWAIETGHNNEIYKAYLINHGYNEACTVHLVATYMQPKA